MATILERSCGSFVLCNSVILELSSNQFVCEMPDESMLLAGDAREGRFSWLSTVEVLDRPLMGWLS